MDSCAVVGQGRAKKHVRMSAKVMEYMYLPIHFSISLSDVRQGVYRPWTDIAAPEYFPKKGRKAAVDYYNTQIFSNLDGDFRLIITYILPILFMNHDQLV